jgi:hypothetical protein
MATLHTYKIPISITASFSAQIDIFEILASSTIPILLMGFELGQISEVGDAQEESLRLVLKRVTGAPTSGSGGGAPTPTPTNALGAAAGVTVETGNTTKLTGGTSATIDELSWNVRAGLLWRPLPEEMITVQVSTRVVLELATTPADAIVGVHGWVSIGEML